MKRSVRLLLSLLTASLLLPACGGPQLKKEQSVAGHPLPKTPQEGYLWGRNTSPLASMMSVTTEHLASLDWPCKIERTINTLADNVYVTRTFQYTPRGFLEASKTTLVKNQDPPRTTSEFTRGFDAKGRMISSKSVLYKSTGGVLVSTAYEHTYDERGQFIKLTAPGKSLTSVRHFSVPAGTRKLVVHSEFLATLSDGTKKSAGRSAQPYSTMDFTTTFAGPDAKTTKLFKITTMRDAKGRIVEEKTSSARTGLHYETYLYTYDAQGRVTSRKRMLRDGKKPVESVTMEYEGDSRRMNRVMIDRKGIPYAAQSFKYVCDGKK